MKDFSIHFTVSLDEASYKKALYWNLFCKSKRSTLILLFLYGCSFISISYSFLLYGTASSMFLITLVPSVLCMLLPLYFIYKLNRQIKKKAASAPVESATKKEITITAHAISILQVLKNITTSYTWNSTKGVYPTSEGLMLYMDDGQIIVMLDRQCAEHEVAQVLELAQENKKLKRGFSPKLVILLFSAVTVMGLYLIFGSL